MPHVPEPRTRPPLIATRPQLIALGWTDAAIRHRVRTGDWKRVTRGTFVTRIDPDGNDSQLMTAAAVRAHGTDAVAILATAADLHGIQGAWPRDGLVHLALPPGAERHQQPGVFVHTRRIPSAEITTSHEIQVTSARRTVVDLACELGRMAAVSVMDSALQQRLIDSRDIDDLWLRTVRRRGARRCRPWWREADGRAQSPLETRVRLLAADAGYPPTTLQLPVTRGGRVVAYGDLAWRQGNGRWLIGEADGLAYHGSPEAVLHDRTRANLIVASGDTDMIRFAWPDTVGRTTVGTTLARFLGPAPRRA